MIIIIGVVLSSRSFKNVPEIVIEQGPKTNTGSEEIKKIKVHVVGAVNNVGVYELSEDNRVIDAVKAAGGATTDADLNATNLAASLIDGQQVRVYTIQEGREAAKSLDLQGNTTNRDGKVNLNNATKEELESLTGIGPVLASKIIEYREAKGGFKSINELKNVSGIGEKKFEQLKNKITI